MGVSVERWVVKIGWLTKFVAHLRVMTSSQGSILDILQKIINRRHMHRKEWPVPVHSSPPKKRKENKF
jgi:hypothetical protein